MKKYTSTISKLYEAESGFEKISIGKEYVSKKGNKFKVLDIYVHASSLVPDAYVTYEFETLEGQKGEEINRFMVFVDMLRNS
jgi:hypothetical protein